MDTLAHRVIVIHWAYQWVGLKLPGSCHCASRPANGVQNAQDRLCLDNSAGKVVRLCWNRCPSCWGFARDTQHHPTWQETHNIPTKQQNRRLTSSTGRWSTIPAAKTLYRTDLPLGKALPQQAHQVRTSISIDITLSSLLQSMSEDRCKSSTAPTPSMSVANSPSWTKKWLPAHSLCSYYLPDSRCSNKNMASNWLQTSSSWRTRGCGTSPRPTGCAVDPRPSTSPLQKPIARSSGLWQRSCREGPAHTSGDGQSSQVIYVQINKKSSPLIMKYIEIPLKNLVKHV